MYIFVALNKDSVQPVSHDLAACNAAENRKLERVQDLVPHVAVVKQAISECAKDSGQSINRSLDCTQVSVADQAAEKCPISAPNLGEIKMKIPIP